MRNKRFTPKVGMNVTVGYQIGQVTEVNKRYFVVSAGDLSGRVYRHKGKSAYRTLIRGARLRVELRKSYDEQTPMSSMKKLTDWLSEPTFRYEVIDALMPSISPHISYGTRTS